MMISFVWRVTGLERRRSDCLVNNAPVPQDAPVTAATSQGPLRTREDKRALGPQKGTRGHKGPPLNGRNNRTSTGERLLEGQLVAEWLLQDRPTATAPVPKAKDREQKLRQ